MKLLKWRSKPSSLPKYKAPQKSQVSPGFQKNYAVSVLSTHHYQGFQNKTFRGNTPTQE